MANTLRISNEYFNNYEAAYKILSKTEDFRQSQWDKAANRGELDQYIALLSNNNITDREYVRKKYNMDYADDETYTAALYNENFANKANTDEKRQRYMTDKNGNYILENGQPVIEEYQASDYEYYASIIKARNDERYRQYLIDQDQERKDSMNGFVKLMADIAGVGGELLSGFAKQMDDLNNSVLAIGKGIGEMLKGGSISDANKAIVETNASNLGRVFWLAEDMILDFERNYTRLRDLNGNYTNVGKYLGGVATTIGQMIPSWAIGNAVGAAAGAAGASAAAAGKMSEVASSLVFYQAMTAGNVKEIYQQFEASGVTPPTNYILANSMVKSTLQYMVEVGLGKVLGVTSLDNLVFGRVIKSSTKNVATKTLTREGIKRIVKDFAQEGLEEVLQDTSDFLVDQAFSKYIAHNFGLIHGADSDKIAEVFSQLTPLTYQSLIDSFIIGGLASFAGHAKNILLSTTSGVRSEDENGNQHRLNPIAAYEYGLNMENYARTFNELYNDIVKYEDDVKKNPNITRDSKEGKKYEAAFTELYASMRMIASIYKTIGEERFKAADNILSEITDMMNKGMFRKSDVTTYAKKFQSILTDMTKDRFDKAVEKLKDAEIDEPLGQATPDNIDKLNLAEETKNSFKNIFEKNKNIKRIIYTKYGTTAVVIDDKLFVPLKYSILDEKGNLTLSTIGEQKLVEMIADDDSHKYYITDIVTKLYKEVSGNNTDRSDVAIANLLYNESFFNMVLSTANKETFEFIKSIYRLQNAVIGKDYRSDEYNNNIKKVFNMMKTQLKEYLVNNVYADYKDIESDILNTKEKKEIAAKRWCKNLYVRVINDKSFAKLTDEDWTVLTNRVNAMPVAQSDKDTILTNLKSNVSSIRQGAMNAIAANYKNIFTSIYDGYTYMPNTTIPNRVFNVFLKSNRLTIASLLDVEACSASSQVQKTIVDKYGKLDRDTLAKYWTEEFSNFCKNNYYVVFNENNSCLVFEAKAQKQFGYDTAEDSSKPSYDLVKETLSTGVDEKEMSKRTFIDTSSKMLRDKAGNNTNTFLYTILDVDDLTKYTCTIDDVISDPSMLNPDIQATIASKYDGVVNPETTFLYLRELCLNTSKGKTSIVILNDGSYAFGDVKPMSDSMTTDFKDGIIKLVRSKSIKAFIKEEYLYGRLADIVVKVDKTLPDAASYSQTSNVIRVSPSILENHDEFAFAILHEFQHAVQVENQMNIGLNANWINNIDAKLRTTIIADIRKHRPEIFKNTEVGSEEEAEVARKFVYYCTGESMAYGVDTNSNIINFYPNVVKYDISEGTTVTLPWGTKYNISSVRPMSLVIKDLSDETVELLNEKAVEEALGPNNRIHYINDEISQFTKNITYSQPAAILEYYRAGIGGEEISHELRRRVVEEFKTYKEQSLKNMYEIFKPDCTYEEFINTPLPVIRFQYNNTIYNSEFVSFGACDIKRLYNVFPSWIKHGYGAVNMFYSFIKPKDTIGYIANNLHELLISTDVAKKMSSAKIIFNDGIPRLISNYETTITYPKVKQSEQEQLFNNILAKFAEVYNFMNANQDKIEATKNIKYSDEVIGQLANVETGLLDTMGVYDLVEYYVKRHYMPSANEARDYKNTFVNICKEDGVDINNLTCLVIKSDIGNPDYSYGMVIRNINDYIACLTSTLFRGDTIYDSYERLESLHNLSIKIINCSLKDLDYVFPNVVSSKVAIDSTNTILKYPYYDISLKFFNNPDNNSDIKESLNDFEFTVTDKYGDYVNDFNYNTGLGPADIADKRTFSEIFTEELNNAIDGELKDVTYGDFLHLKKGGWFRIFDIDRNFGTISYVGRNVYNHYSFEITDKDVDGVKISTSPTKELDALAAEGYTDIKIEKILNKPEIKEPDAKILKEIADTTNVTDEELEAMEIVQDVNATMSVVFNTDMYRKDDITVEQKNYLEAAKNIFALKDKENLILMKLYSLARANTGESNFTSISNEKIAEIFVNVINAMTYYVQDKYTMNDMPVTPARATTIINTIMYDILYLRMSQEEVRYIRDNNPNAKTDRKMVAAYLASDACTSEFRTLYNVLEQTADWFINKKEIDRAIWNKHLKIYTVDDLISEIKNGLNYSQDKQLKVFYDNILSQFKEKSNLFTPDLKRVAYDVKAPISSATTSGVSFGANIRLLPISKYRLDEVATHEIIHYLTSSRLINYEDYIKTLVKSGTSGADFLAEDAKDIAVSNNKYTRALIAIYLDVMKKHAKEKLYGFTNICEFAAESITSVLRKTLLDSLSNETYDYALKLIKNKLILNEDMLFENVLLGMINEIGDSEYKEHFDSINKIPHYISLLNEEKDLEYQDADMSMTITNDNDRRLYNMIFRQVQWIVKNSPTRLTDAEILAKLKEGRFGDIPEVLLTDIIKSAVDSGVNIRDTLTKPNETFNKTQTFEYFGEKFPISSEADKKLIKNMCSFAYKMYNAYGTLHGENKPKIERLAEVVQKKFNGIAYSEAVKAAKIAINYFKDGLSKLQPGDRVLIYFKAYKFDIASAKWCTITGFETDNQPRIVGKSIVRGREKMEVQYSKPNGGYKYFEFSRDDVIQFEKGTPSDFTERDRSVPEPKRAPSDQEVDLSKYTKATKTELTTLNNLRGNTFAANHPTEKERATDNLEVGDFVRLYDVSKYGAGRLPRWYKIDKISNTGRGKYYDLISLEDGKKYNITGIDLLGYVKANDARLDDEFKVLKDTAGNTEIDPNAEMSMAAKSTDKKIDELVLKYAGYVGEMFKDSGKTEEEAAKKVKEYRETLKGTAPEKIDELYKAYTKDKVKKIKETKTKENEEAERKRIKDAAEKSAKEMLDLAVAANKTEQGTSARRKSKNTGSRYVTQKEGEGTNLEKYGYTAPYKKTEMSTELKNFIIGAHKGINKELWDKVKDGTISTMDVMDFLRDSDDIDDATFKLINDSYFQNKYITTYDELKKYLNKTESYYAARAIVKELIANNVDTEYEDLYNKILYSTDENVYKELLRIIENDPVLRNKFENIINRYSLYGSKKNKSGKYEGGTVLNISTKLLKRLWMEYYDGSIYEAGYIAVIPKYIAIKRWLITGEGSSKANVSLSQNVGDEGDGTLEDFIPDENSENPFLRILSEATRDEKIAEIKAVLISKHVEEFKAMGYTEAQKKLQRITEKLEGMPKKQFDEQYLKLVKNLTKEEIDELYVRAASKNVLELNNLDEKQQEKANEFEDSAVKAYQSNWSVVNRIKAKVRTINRNLSANDVTRFLKDNEDVFEKNPKTGKVKVKDNLIRNERGRYKDIAKLNELEDVITKTTNKVKAEVYANSANVKLQKSFDKKIKAMQKEIDQLVKQLLTEKSKKPMVYMVNQEQMIVQDREMPACVQRLFETQFDKTQATKVKYVVEGDRQYIKSDYNKWIDENAEYLNNITQAEAEEMADFFIESNIIPPGSQIRKYVAIQMYTITYLIKANRCGHFILSEDTIKALNERLYTITSLSAQALGVWKGLLPELDPQERIIQSMAKRMNITFRKEDIADFVSAVQASDIARMYTVKERMYKDALLQWNGSKKSFLSKLLQFERLAMLSGPGTWARNFVSNVIIENTNKWGYAIGTGVQNMLLKLFPNKFKHRTGQYLLNAKVDANVQNFIKVNFIDNGFIRLVSSGLGKYNPQNHVTGDAADALTDIVCEGIKIELFDNKSFKNKYINEAQEFVMKMLSDNKFINRSAIKYLGKMLVEDKVDLTQGLSKDVINTFANAYKLAAYDYMHKNNFFLTLENELHRRLGEGWYFMYKQVFPFAAASWNWFVEGLNYTPVGLVKGILQLAKLEKTIERMDDARTSGYSNISNRFAEYLAKRNIGKGVIGSITLAIGMILALLGKARIDDEDDKYKLFVNVGTDTIAIDITDVFGTQGVLLGIAIVSTLKGDKPLSVITEALNEMFNNSVYSEVFNSFRHSDSFGDWLANQPFAMLNMFVPNFVSTISSIANVHKIRYGGGIKTKFELFASKAVPGLAYIFPKLIDPYTGETQIPYKAQIFITFVNKLAPFKIQPYNVSDIEKEAISVGVSKSELTCRYTINDKRVNVKPKYVSMANVLYGKLNNKDLTDLYNNKTAYKIYNEKTKKYVTLKYNKMTDEQKKTVIERIMNNNGDIAKIYILTSTGKYKYYANDEMYAKLKKLGIKTNVYKKTDKREGFVEI